MSAEVELTLGGGEACSGVEAMRTSTTLARHEANRRRSTAPCPALHRVHEGQADTLSTCAGVDSNSENVHHEIGVQQSVQLSVAVSDNQAVFPCHHDDFIFGGEGILQRGQGLGQRVVITHRVTVQCLDRCRIVDNSGP